MAARMTYSELYTCICDMMKDNATTNKGMPFVDIITSKENGAFPSPNALYCVLNIWGADPNTAINVTKTIFTFTNIPGNCSADKHIRQPNAEHQKKYGTYDTAKKYKATCITISEPELDADGKAVEHRTFSGVREELTKLGMHGIASSFGLTQTSPNEHAQYVFCCKVLTSVIQTHINKMGAALYNPDSPDHEKAKELFGGPSAKDFRGCYLESVNGAKLKHSKAYMDIKYKGEGSNKSIETKINTRVPTNRAKSGFASSSGGTKHFPHPVTKVDTILTYQTLPDFLSYGSLYSGVGRFQLQRMQAGMFLKFVVTDLVRIPAPARIGTQLMRDEGDVELDESMLEQYDSSGSSNPLQQDDISLDALGGMLPKQNHPTFPIPTIDPYAGAL
jgi:hypothetical protein